MFPAIKEDLKYTSLYIVTCIFITFLFITHICYSLCLHRRSDYIFIYHILLPYMIKLPISVSCIYEIYSPTFRPMIGPNRLST